MACVAAAPDGLTAASGSLDWSVRLWDLVKGACTNNGGGLAALATRIKQLGDLAQLCEKVSTPKALEMQAQIRNYGWTLELHEHVQADITTAKATATNHKNNSLSAWEPA